MTSATLLAELRALGATVRLHEGHARVEAPHGVLTSEHRAGYAQLKDELVALLGAEAADARIAAMWTALAELPAPKRPLDDTDRALDAALLAAADAAVNGNDAADVDHACAAIEAFWRGLCAPATTATTAAPQACIVCGKVRPVMVTIAPRRGGTYDLCSVCRLELPSARPAPRRAA